jgi:LuxR family transcriptional regulator, quorum-sensing system regulator BjaR1
MAASSVLCGNDAMQPDSTQRRPRLTSRERECLRWCSLGKTNWEISRILGLSERTVEHYLARVNRKLGTATRIQAVAVAKVQGEI